MKRHPASTTTWAASLSSRWQALQTRERAMIGLAALVVGGALLWQWAIQPAWKTYRSYERERLALERQVQAMQSMRQQAVQLQELLASSAQQGSAASLTSRIQTQAHDALGQQVQTALAGDRFTVRFQNAPAAALAQWLRETRENTRSQPLQVQLTRPASDANSGVTWSGQVVWALPNAASGQ